MIDFGLIWPNNPFLVPHCFIFVCLCIVHPPATLLLGEKRPFLLCYSLYYCAPECSSYCFDREGCVGYVLQGFGNISGIFSFLKSDEADGILGINRWKLLWIATKRLCKWWIMFGMKVWFIINTYTNVVGNSMTRQSFVKQFRNAVVLSRSEWVHEGLRKNFLWWVVGICAQGIFLYIRWVTWLYFALV